jgi:hypothetical protein
MGRKWVSWTAVEVPPKRSRDVLGGVPNREDEDPHVFIWRPRPPFPATAEPIAYFVQQATTSSAFQPSATPLIAHSAIGFFLGSSSQLASSMVWRSERRSANERQVLLPILTGPPVGEGEDPLVGHGC